MDVEVSLATAERVRLPGIDAALQRIKDGMFGKCCKCGHKISEARLRAVPDASYCASCEKSSHQS